MSFINGLVYNLIAVILWGCIQVIYFENIKYIPPLEIVSHRAIWAFFFILILIALRKKIFNFFEIFKNKKKLLYLITTAMLISSNWFFLIKSISTENVQDAAMGYYISPIVSVALGYIIFKEKFSKIQFLSLILILIAMINLIVNIGSIPWIAISLATTWSLYGVIRKKVNIDSEVGLFFELSLLLPIFLGYSILLNQNGTGHFILDDKYTIFFLIGGGLFTALPLFFFNLAIRLIPLSLSGIIFYLVPTLQFLTAIIYLGEVISFEKIISFIIIWIAVILFIFESIKINKKNK